MPKLDRAEKVWDRARLAQQQEHRQAQAETFRQRHLDQSLARTLRRLQEELNADHLSPQSAP